MGAHIRVNDLDIIAHVGQLLHGGMVFVESGPGPAPGPLGAHCNSNGTTRLGRVYLGDSEKLRAPPAAEDNR